MKQSQFARALWYGILGALFFAFTFIFNRSMNLSGGSWMWSASLRYLFSLPMLAVLVWRKGELVGVLSAIKKAPLTWLVWSTVGFGLFYGPLSLASIYGEAWFLGGRLADPARGGYLADYHSCWSALDASLWAEGTW